MLPDPKQGPHKHLVSALVAILESSASFIYLKIMVDETSAVGELEFGEKEGGGGTDIM